jgi:hypothetical protein
MDRRTPDVRPIPAGDETWVAIVEHVASTVTTAVELEERLRVRYPDCVVLVGGLETMTRPIWTVYRRRRRARR